MEAINPTAAIPAQIEEPTIINPKSRLWKKVKVDDWKNSVLNEDSVFYDLYLDTRRRIIEACASHAYDVIVEVGCGTGEVISHLEEAGIQRIGIDINETFIEHCRTTYKHQSNLAFHVCDATKLDLWWKQSGYADKFKAPLMVCPNNTITVMAEGIREDLLKKMRVVAGTDGRCVITFWNGRLFAHGVMGYYKRNNGLCGDFELDEVNWEGRSIETRTSYRSAWLTAKDIVRWMNSLLIEVDLAKPEKKETLEIDHVAEYGIGVYLWLSGTAAQEDAAASARDYYDSKDAQTFYQEVWGDNTHIGRYDLIEADPKLSALSTPEKIRQAQNLHQEHLLSLVDKFYDGAQIRCLDMGCGYGGLLRSMAKRGMLWSGIGVDISGRMIDKCRQLTQQQQESQDDVQETLSFQRENYMNTSVPNEGIDLVISMDAFDHAGAGQHESVLSEAWRVLRPGGRLIFADIMLRPDAPPDKAVDLQKRMNMKAFGSVQDYERFAELCGFRDFTFEDHSTNISKHYGTVHDILEELWANDKIAVSKSFKDKQSAELLRWHDLAPSCLQWGIVSMRKMAKKRKLAAHP